MPTGRTALWADTPCTSPTAPRPGLSTGPRWVKARPNARPSAFKWDRATRHVWQRAFPGKGTWRQVGRLAHLASPGLSPGTLDDTGDSLAPAEHLLHVGPWALAPGWIHVRAAAGRGCINRGIISRREEIFPHFLILMWYWVLF